MIQKLLDQSEFRIQELWYRFEFLYVIRQSQMQQVAIVRHCRPCPELSLIVSQFHLKNELYYKVIFFHVVRDPYWLQGSTIGIQCSMPTFISMHMILGMHTLTRIFWFF